MDEKSTESGVKSADLSTLEGFALTVEQIKNSAASPEASKSGFVELDVKLPRDQDKNEQSVTLFMANQDQYIVGMVGGDGKPYYFRDKGKEPEGLREYLRARGRLEKDGAPLDSGLSVDHNSLGTLDGDQPGHTFGMSDLMAAGRINSFGKDARMRTAEDLKKPVSLLVCMLAEAARHQQMETEFRKVYSPAIVQTLAGASVNVPNTASANAAIRVFNKAARITAWANEWVNERTSSARVEVLMKRADSINQAVTVLEAADGVTVDGKELDRILDGKYPNEGKGAQAAKDIRTYARGLDNQGRRIPGELLREILNLRRHKPRAFDAALTGVTVGLARLPGRDSDDTASEPRRKRK